MRIYKESNIRQPLSSLVTGKRGLIFTELSPHASSGVHVTLFNCHPHHNVGNFTHFIERDIEAQRLSDLHKVMGLIKHKTRTQIQASETLPPLISSVPFYRIALFAHLVFKGGHCCIWRLDCLLCYSDN